MFADAKERVTGILSMPSVGSGTNSEEARMALSRYKVGAGLAVSDMDRARGFSEVRIARVLRRAAFLCTGQRSYVATRT
jgi:hypothetical protein